MPVSKLLLAISSILALSLVLAAASQAQERRPVLRGRAVEQGYLPQGQPPGPPALSRSDIERLGDPFGGDPDFPQVIEPPAKSFGLTASSGPAAAGRPQAPRAADAEDQGLMQIAWDAWHKRVGQVIYQRWSFLANAAFQSSPPLLCRVSYVVSRDGKVSDVKLLVESEDVMYNLLAVQAVQSISGDCELLKFPPGSRRISVEKVADFCQNCDAGNTVRFATGDKETIGPGK